MNTHLLTLLHWSLAKLGIAAMEGERSSLPYLIPNQCHRNLGMLFSSRRLCCCRLRINNKIMHAALCMSSVHIRWGTGDSSPNEMWSSSCDDPIINEAEQLTSTEEIKGSNYSKKPQRRDTLSYNNLSNPTFRWRLALIFVPPWVRFDQEIHFQATVASFAQLFYVSLQYFGSEPHPCGCRQSRLTHFYSRSHVGR